MPPGFVLLANLAVGALLVAVAGTSRLARVPVRRSLSLASLPLLIAAVLSVYVFGDDNYRGNGISRSQGRARGALGSMFVLSVALMAVCAAGLVYAGLGAKERLFRVAAFAGGLTSLVLLTATIIGFTAN